MTHLVPALRPVMGTPFRRGSLYRAAGEVPSFHVAPARTGNARDLITGSVLGTYNSASPAWAVGPDEVLFQPTANAPVIEYDSTTLACLGARIWWVVTNQTRNNTMVGAAAGTPGTLPTNWSTSGFSGLTRQIVGIGTFQGVDYIDIRFNGTATGTFGNINLEQSTVIAAANGQTWTGSTWAQIVGGSTAGLSSSITIVAAQNTSLGAYIADTANGTISAAVSTVFQRVSRAHTTNQATTAFIRPYIQIGFTNGAAIDITLRIGLPQLEQSATVGPVVKTTTTAASSTADVWDLTSLTAGINNLKTLYFRGRTQASGTRGIASLNDNTANNRMELSTSGTTAKAVAVTSGSTVADLSGGTIAANTTFRLAVRLDTDSYALSLNGGAVVTDTSGARALVDRLFLGRDQAGNYMNGYIEEMAGWTRACTDAQVAALAAS